MSGLLSPKVRVFALLPVAVVAADRVTKAWVERELALGEQRTIIDNLFYLTHARNPGAAFGLFSDFEVEAKALVFGAAAALALLVVALHLIGLAPGDRRVASALALVAGGAIGNLIDRMPMLGGGEVIDFLHFDLWSGYDWPDFNLADVAIVLGVAGLLVDIIAREATERASRDATGVDESRA